MIKEDGISEGRDGVGADISNSNYSKAADFVQDSCKNLSKISLKYQILTQEISLGLECVRETS